MIISQDTVIWLLIGAVICLCAAVMVLAVIALRHERQIALLQKDKVQASNL